MTVRAAFTTVLLTTAAGSGGLLAGFAIRPGPVREVAVPAAASRAVIESGILISRPGRTPPAAEPGADVGSHVLRIFGDYECPACQALESKVGDEWRSLAAAGRLTVIYHHRPLERHRNGELAASLAYCGDVLGMGAAVHAELQRTARQWSGSGDPGAALLEAAVRAGVPRDSVAACASSGRVREHVAADRRLADALGIDAVPAVFLDGRRLEYRSFAALRAYLSERTGRR